MAAEGTVNTPLGDTSRYSSSYTETASITTLSEHGQMAYGANRYYSGGASTPYRAGLPVSQKTPVLLPASFLNFIGHWRHPVYVYSFSEYHYTSESNNHNTSIAVACLCEQYQECGCGENNSLTYYESLFNGTQPKNTSVVCVALMNGTEKMYINGTLANGTTAAESSAASGPRAIILQVSRYSCITAIGLGAMWSCLLL